MGENVRVIDPAPAVAKQAKRLLEANGIKNQAGDDFGIRFYTSGNTKSLTSILPKLLGEVGIVKQITWLNDHTILAI